MSLLLALLRKRMLEFDAGVQSGDDQKLIIERSQIAELMQLFLREATNEAKLMNRIDTHIEKIVDLGFLRKLRGSDNAFEVRRIIKAFVDAQWLNEFHARLTEYRDHQASGSSHDDGAEAL